MLTPQSRPARVQNFPQITTSPLVGVQIISSHGEIFNHVDDDLEMWSGKGDRKVDIIVRFAAPFQRPPHITLGVTGVDASHTQNLRYQLEAVNVSQTGFTVRFRTWGDTRIARASASWTAIGSAVSRDASLTKKGAVEPAKMPLKTTDQAFTKSDVATPIIDKAASKTTPVEPTKDGMSVTNKIAASATLAGSKETRVRRIVVSGRVATINPEDKKT